MTKDYNLELENLNSEVTPLLAQYKILQKTYIDAVNNGGCFISINGPCESDPIRTNHPYFLQNNKSGNTATTCTQKQVSWQERCDNSNVDALYVSKNENNVYLKLQPMAIQIDSLNAIILDKFNRMQSLMKKQGAVKGDSITKKQIINGMAQLLKEKRKYDVVINKSNNSIHRILGANYLKYIYWLCLVILLVVTIIYSAGVMNITIPEIIIFTCIILYVVYYFYTYISKKFNW